MKNKKSLLMSLKTQSVKQQQMLSSTQYFVVQHSKNKGVQLMLDAVIDYLPSPLDVKPIVGHRADDPDEEVIAKADDDAEFAALAFKVMTDPYVGKLTFFRVYSGTLTSGSYVKTQLKVNVNV